MIGESTHTEIQKQWPRTLQIYQSLEWINNYQDFHIFIICNCRAIYKNMDNQAKSKKNPQKLDYQFLSDIGTQKELPANLYSYKSRVPKIPHYQQCSIHYTAV